MMDQAGEPDQSRSLITLKAMNEEVHNIMQGQTQEVSCHLHLCAAHLTGGHTHCPSSSRDRCTT